MRKEIPQIPQNIEYPHIELRANTQIHFVFSAHQVKTDLGDFEHFRSIVKQADIMFWERAGWQKEFSDGLNRLSKGDFRAYQRVKAVIKANNWSGNTPYDFAIMEAVYNSDTLIRLIDVSEKDPFYPLVSGLIAGKAIQEGLDFEQAIAHIEANYAKSSSGNRFRESRMLGRIGSILRDGLNPKLRDKRSLNTMVLAGTLHTKMHDHLAADYPERVTQEFITPGSAILNPNFRAMKAHMYDEVKDMSGQERRKLYVDAIGYYMVYKMIERYLGREPVSRTKLNTADIVANLTEDDIKALYEMHQGGEVDIEVKSKTKRLIQQYVNPLTD